MSIEHFYKDKVVLITGASMGIGKELARQVLAFGGKAVLTARNEERLLGVQKEFEQYKDRMLIHTGDVANYEDSELLMEKIHGQFGKLDVLINNAGISCYGEMEKLQPEVIKQVVDTNIYGPVYQTMTALKKFKSSLDSVLFVSSIAAFHGLPEYAAYSFTKKALYTLAQSLRMEVAGEKVFVGIAYVGFTENEKQKIILSPEGEKESVPVRPKILLSTREETARKILKQIERRRFSETHSLIGKLLFFMSKYFTSPLGFLMRRKYMKQKANMPIQKPG